MGGILHPTGGTYGMNLQEIRLCGPALGISCSSPNRSSLAAEAAWEADPPTLEDFERAAAARIAAAAPATGAATKKKTELLATVAVGIDVDSLAPKAAPSDSFGRCVKSASPTPCASSLLGPWANLSATTPLPATGDVWSAQLWNRLVGDATFDTQVSYFASFTPPNNSMPIAPPTTKCAGVSCVRVLGFRSVNSTSTILLMVNLDTEHTFMDKGDTGRDLYYIHRKEVRTCHLQPACNLVTL